MTVCTQYTPPCTYTPLAPHITPDRLASAKGGAVGGAKGLESGVVRQGIIRSARGRARARRPSAALDDHASEHAAGYKS